MSAVDYAGIMNAIQATIEAAVPNVLVVQEAETNPGIEDQSVVAIYCIGRSAPADHQRMSAGRQTHMDLTISMFCAAFSLESVKQAKLDALALAGEVERVLMGNPDLAGTVRRFYLEGGIIDGSQGDGSFVGLAEVRLVAWVVSRL